MPSSSKVEITFFEPLRHWHRKDDPKLTYLTFKVGKFASVCFSSWRVSGGNLLDSTLVPSNQTQDSLIDIFLSNVTVIDGPPDFNLTTSPTLNSMFVSTGVAYNNLHLAGTDETESPDEGKIRPRFLPGRYCSRKLTNFARLFSRSLILLKESDRSHCQHSQATIGCELRLRAQRKPEWRVCTEGRGVPQGEQGPPPPLDVWGNFRAGRVPNTFCERRQHYWYFC
jgi:hypothetical protein